MKHYGDITKLSGYELPIVDVITGGSPCQDLSVAGKRAGLAGERSGLFMEQLRIVKEMRERDERDNGRTAWLVRPRYMVWENVPGAFSSGDPKGADFAAVLEEIIKTAEPDASVQVPVPDGGWTKSGCYYSAYGRWSLAWRLHDAQFWGVPQRRKRIALVADFGGLSAPEILFERKSVRGDLAESGEARQGTARGTESGVGSTGFHITQDPISTIEKTPCIGTGNSEHGQCSVGVALSFMERGGGGHGGKGFLAKTEITGSITGTDNQKTFQNTGKGWWNESKIGATVRTPTGSGALEANLISAVDCRNGTENSKTNGTLQSKDSGGQSLNYQNVVRVCGTVNPGAHPGSYNGQDVYNDMLIPSTSTVRRLTPLETERLQGFPDNWSKYGINERGEVYELPDSARYRLQGNSIAVGYANNKSGFWMWLMKRISAQYERSATLGSLFDGQGGFPLAWEFYNGEGSALWASEIEKHAIAVTKYHFPEV